MEKASKGIDAYIVRAPKTVQGKLREVRTAIREAAPASVESISYRMPCYDKGRIAWFAIRKTYIGLYLRPPVIEEYKKELADYETTKSSIHFPLDQRIPVRLIKRLIKSRRGKNEAKR